MKIALLGFGTVGSGAFEAIKDSVDLEVKRILEIRELPGYEEYVTKDINDILNDDEIELVAECMGGLEPAATFMLDAMNHGKHVVTPNKSLVSKRYAEFKTCAEKNGVEFRFTPAAGGGIPWLYNLKRQRRCDKILSVSGIVNGTSNYILDNMHSGGMSFDDALAEAKSLGYAEADPSADIKGWDTQRKCVLSANVGFGTRIRNDDLDVFGIDTIKACDISYFNEKGYVCRLMMNAGIIEDKLYAYVEPMLFRSGDLEANVKTNYNLITLEGQNVGTLSFYGQGAGKMPTGTSLVHDMIDIQTKLDFDSYIKPGEVPTQVDNSMIEKRYFMHFERGVYFPFEIVESQHEQKDEYYVITKPISVKYAHEIASDILADGENFFMAGIKE
jgi:homoserine dehydrogenase